MKIWRISSLNLNTLSRYTVNNKDVLLNFDSFLSLENRTLPFMNYSIFLSLTNYFENDPQRNILIKIHKYGKPLSDRLKLYLSFFIESLFSNPSAFTERIKHELQDLIENENQRTYIYYLFLGTRAFKKFQLKSNLRTVPESQLNNLFLFLKWLMEKEVQRSKPNEFLLYSILRFASFVETNSKTTLIKKMSELKFIKQAQFWMIIMNFMSKSIYGHLNKKKSIEETNNKSGSSNLFKNFGSFFKKKNSPQKKDITKSSDIKSFEEISSLLFRIGIEFENIIDILIYLSSSVNIQFSMMRNILLRNKEVLYKQLEHSHQEKLTSEVIEVYHKKKSYLALIRLEKGLSAFACQSKTMSMSDSHILKKGNLANSKSAAEIKYDKIYRVIKLSLKFITAKYDSKGDLLIADLTSDIKESSQKDQEEKKMLSKLRNDPKKKVLSKKESSEVKKRLKSLRNNDISGFDDLLENATKISQASKSSTMKDQDQNEDTLSNLNFDNNKFSFDHNNKNNKKPSLLQTDLSDILNILLISKSMYKFKDQLLKKVLNIVWPLENAQRKFIYKSLINKNITKEKLIDYDENTYVFERINQQIQPADSTHKLTSHEQDQDISSNSGFGETFVKSGLNKQLQFGLNKNLSNQIIKKNQISKKNNLIMDELSGSLEENDTQLKIKEDSAEEGDDDELNETPSMKTINSSNLGLKSKSIGGNIGSLNSGKDMEDSKSESSQKDIARSFNRTDSNNSNKYLPIKPKMKKQLPSEKDNIISLDVKRTHVERAQFDHVALEQILRNISNPTMGNFAYYQGLNYIVAFFLDLMREPVDTYNMTMTLLEIYFRKYVNSNMENLKVLFYVLRRLIKIYLPELSDHIENTESLETNVIFANWILTLFTTLKQFSSRVALLDQIVDIFISKGWTGFFRCILVILSHLQNDILDLQAENLIMFMTDFPKRSFSLLGQKFNTFENQSIILDCNFNFKEECLKYESIGNLLVHEMSMEYHNLQDSFEKKWLSLIKKVEKIYK